MGKLLSELFAETEAPATPATLRLFSTTPVARVAESRKSQEAEAAGTQASRLLAAIRAESLPESLIAAHDGTPDQLAELSDTLLRTYTRMLHETRLREQGKRPESETAVALCKHCGPVWVHPDVATVLPVVRGWPTCVGCPWCHVRHRAGMSRPKITCGNCRHFVRDALNPAQGAGRCNVGHSPERPWPMVQHVCDGFGPRGGA